ncbi:peptide ABC transporter permease [Vallitalea longa]|uniref:Peptide ABC transporter permease n=1 Tax=Vallitalea longa TaxID=2936439 RepID=A0A9W5YBB4_9FIRM|nr:ABC transporter permease [Vallitalea longa]GKX28123.1 peptide ABC transporter permease [Vallitalea longa]
MIRYTIERIILIFVTVLIVVTINFFLLRLMPGSPFANPKITQAQIEMMEAKYGLDDPSYVQYFRYIKNLIVKQDLGVSLKMQDQPVSKLVKMKLPHTVKIGTIALIFGVIVGIFLGAIAAIYRNSFWDNLVTILAVIGVSIPNFVLAAFLQYFFCTKLGWFPYIYNPVDALRKISTWDSLYSSLLPALSLSLYVTSSTMRYMRSELVEVLSSDYILLARAKGFSKPKVIFRHALRNALIPVITIVGPMAVNILTGGVIVEQFFGVPGLGKLLVNGIFSNDYFVILGVNLILSFLYISIILVVDLLYGVIDPRIRLKGGGV